MFQDLTGGLDELAALAWRTARQPWSGRVRATRAATRRLAGLVGRPGSAARAAPDLDRPAPPGDHPGGQRHGPVRGGGPAAGGARFQGRPPWTPDPELPDPLEQALQAWTARAVRAWLAALLESGADLWLIHDRGVVYGSAPVGLGPLEPDWTAQLRADEPLEVSDPLCGVDLVREIQARTPTRHQRWLWPVAPGQTHVMEAMRIPTS